MKKVGILPNITKDKDMKLTKEIINWIEKNNGQALLNEIDGKRLDRCDLAYKNHEMYQKADFIIVLGGDGTLLGVSRRIGKFSTPIFGVNLGRQGFLTEVEINGLYPALENIMAGKYTIEKRMMLEAVVMNNNVPRDTFFALNDVVIAKGDFARIVRLKTYVDDKYLDTFPADGLIVSSPTGSTAYSLSAGGPIVNPQNDLLIVTPISPYTLHARSIIVSEKEKIHIEVEGDNNEIILTMDGQEGYILEKGDSILVGKADFYANFIRLNNRTFYDVLRNKLAERSTINNNQDYL